MTHEDVISWLEYLSDDARSKADRLVPTNIEIACGMAIDALKAQEPKPPIVKENSYGWKFYYCPSCRNEFYQNNKFNFCEKCGQAVKWE